YSPENDADAIFTQLNLKLVKALSGGGGVLLNPDKLVEYNAQAVCRLGIYNALSLNYRYREYKADPALWRYLGIGFDYYY
ncbi:MAG: hypothetical protein U1C33_01770, partial [Candidatus Cloacimonadaceae bacterium]|nr:hypothetical protein [Candidatus Cloacimonadaceae bacterium]